MKALATTSLMTLVSVATAARAEMPPASAPAGSARSPASARKEELLTSRKSNKGPGLVVRWQHGKGQSELIDLSPTDVLLREASALVCRDVASGARRWSLPLVAFQGKTAATRRAVANSSHIYAVNGDEVVMVDRKMGKVLKRKPLAGVRRLLLVDSGLYVAAAGGISRLRVADLQQVATIGGHRNASLEGADGDHVALHRTLDNARRGSPKRLSVFNLKTSKKVYEFRLLRRGGHQVISMADGKLAFLDFARQETKPKKKRLYFTVADHRRGRKEVDISLKNHYGTKSAETFAGSWVDSQTVLIAKRSGESGALMVLDVPTRRVRWRISVPRLLSDPVVAHGLVWLAEAKADGAARLAARRLTDGQVTQRVALPGATKRFTQLAAVGQTLALVGGGAVSLVGKRQPARLDQPAATWKTYRDTLAGYTVKLPKSWRLAAKHIKHYGPGAFAVPFVRYRRQTRADGTERWIFVGAIHVLVRPAGGQDARAVWQAVLAQRGTRAGAKVEQVAVEELRLGKINGVVGTYRFKNRFGRLETARSLCVASHGSAFELRARLKAPAAEQWAEIAAIFGTFRARPKLVKPRPQAPGTP